eukprot:10557115-Alexandrium_andersonii.AAC.1
MSASLVGSEMCIRDSLEGLFAQAFETRHQGSGAGIPEAGVDPLGCPGKGPREHIEQVDALLHAQLEGLALRPEPVL